MANQVLPGEQTFVDQNGDPLSGGLVYMYFPNTTNFSITWSDQAGTIPNTNPIVLDQAGRASIWGVGSYRQVVTDQFGNVQWDQITTSGPTAPIPGEIAGDLSVGGNASIAGSLVVGGGLTVTNGFNVDQISASGNIQTAGILLADQLQARTGSVINVTSNLQLGSISIANNNITGVSSMDSQVARVNDIYTDHIHNYSVGSITIDEPIFTSSGIEINTNNITNVGTLGAVNVAASGNVFTNGLACNGASFINIDCSIAVAATGGPDGITVTGGGIVVNGPHVHISAFDPTIGLTAPGGSGFGMWYTGSGLAWGTVDGNGNASGSLMTMDGGGNLSTSGELFSAGGAMFGSNVLPSADNVGSVGQGGQRWQVITGYDAVFQNYITGSTDATSTPLAMACLPLVASINVKTAPHIGLAKEDVAPVMGAVVTSRGSKPVEGVSYNAIVACLWKALQELNAAFNAYVAAHP